MLPHVLDCIDVSAVRSPATWSLIFTLLRITASSLRTFLSIHLQPSGAVQYCCISRFVCFAERFSLYAVASLDAYSAPRWSGPTYAVSFSFSFVWVWWCFRTLMMPSNLCVECSVFYLALVSGFVLRWSTGWGGSHLKQSLHATFSSFIQLSYTRLYMSSDATVAVLWLHDFSIVRHSLYAVDSCTVRRAHTLPLWAIVRL